MFPFMFVKGKTSNVSMYTIACCSFTIVRTVLSFVYIKVDQHAVHELHAGPEVVLSGLRCIKFISTLF